MGNGQWAMGNGQWAMGNGQWAMGNGQWAMDLGLTKLRLRQLNIIFLLYFTFSILHSLNTRAGAKTVNS
jgi:hypothetical protein